MPRYPGSVDTAGLDGNVYPSYVDGGYAIHGDTYVPPFPVSHGCIRMPDWLAVPFFERNPVGTPVFVEP